MGQDLHLGMHGQVVEINFGCRTAQFTVVITPCMCILYINFVACFSHTPFYSPGRSQVNHTLWKVLNLLSCFLICRIQWPWVWVVVVIWDTINTFPCIGTGMYSLLSLYLYLSHTHTHTSTFHAIPSSSIYGQTSAVIVLFFVFDFLQAQQISFNKPLPASPLRPRITNGCSG